MYSQEGAVEPMQKKFVRYFLSNRNEEYLKNQHQKLFYIY
jgi:hypothetical protein